MKYSKFNKYIFTTLSIAAFYCLFSPTYSQPNNVNINKNIHLHQNIIKNKLDFYNNRFKDIKFIHLDGGDDWKAELELVLKLLAGNAVALDYEHPKELQQDLMYVTIERLKYMLENAEMSSTLFRVGDKSTIQQSNLCVVSLNPETLIMDESESLRYMLDYSDERIKKIHPSRYINAQDFIEYSLEHEVFHCLDSFLYGGAPMSFEILGGEYNQIRRESAADAFALIMHLKMNGKLTNFARNMVHIRALSLYNNCPNHNTFNTIMKILRLNTSQFKAMSIMEIISLSKQVANKTIGHYLDFRNQQALELRAIKFFNNELLRSEEKLKDLEKTINNPSKVEALIERSRYFYIHLFTDTVIDLESIQLD